MERAAARGLGRAVAFTGFASTVQAPRAKRAAGVHGSDLAQGKRYDQILHLSHTRRAFTDRGGVVDFYAGDYAPLFPRAAMTKRQFTYELSDHLPLWTEPRVA